MSDLRARLIKLGYEAPELRGHLRPVIDKVADYEKARSFQEEVFPALESDLYEIAKDAEVRITRPQRSTEDNLTTFKVRAKVRERIEWVEIAEILKDKGYKPLGLKVQQLDDPYLTEPLTFKAPIGRLNQKQFKLHAPGGKVYLEIQWLK